VFQSPTGVSALGLSLKGKDRMILDQLQVSLKVGDVSADVKEMLRILQIMGHFDAG
jgi:hypothetical protein